MKVFFRALNCRLSFRPENSLLLWSKKNSSLQQSASDLSNGFVGDGFRGCQVGGFQRRNKSPSDLEADDENDHDSLNQV